MQIGADGGDSEHHYFAVMADPPASRCERCSGVKSRKSIAGLLDLMRPEVRLIWPDMARAGD